MPAKTGSQPTLRAIEWRGPVGNALLDFSVILRVLAAQGGATMLAG
jgi:hypothetical protein